MCLSCGSRAVPCENAQYLCTQRTYTRADDRRTSWAYLTFSYVPYATDKFGSRRGRGLHSFAPVVGSADVMEFRSLLTLVAMPRTDGQ